MMDNQEKYTDLIIRIGAYPKASSVEHRRATIRAAYLDYFNDYLSVAVFAGDYGITLDLAHCVINIGRNLQEGHAKKEAKK